MPWLSKGKELQKISLADNVLKGSAPFWKKDRLNGDLDDIRIDEVRDEKK